jgi:aspartate/methionine/tyrosine aminotransferase
MRFAERCAFDNGVSAYGAALAKARAAGGLLDLTVSNPTRCGFAYPAEALLRPLGDPAVLQYAADPLGMRSAREAVAGLYREAYGAEIAAERVLLSASTSEAYSFLLRLLCDPGDAILVPSPSYPLFDLLARLHDVELVPYPLVYHDGWQIDPASLEAAVTERTRAIVAIHPNNPTGHFCGETDRSVLFEVAERYGLPLIVDEVFLDYPVESAGAKSFAVGGGPVPVFVLGGLSKLLALPQMKLSWTVVAGPEREADEAMERLEVIADTFLSVATPPQIALPVWLGLRQGIQAQIAERVRRNLAALDRAVAGTAVSRLRVEGGWAAVLRVPATGPDVEMAVRLIQAVGVAVHPGSFYGFASSGWLVVSLLPEATAFHAGLSRLVAACG